MENNLDVIKNEIIEEIPTDNNKFDTRLFIRGFEKRFAIEYAGFLDKYEQNSFKHVHGQIGKFLSANQNLLKIKNVGIIQSLNVFGIYSPNQMWIKTV